jgi:hypothetical protein
MRAVVPEEEIPIARHSPVAALPVAELRVHVRLVEPPAVDEDDSVALHDGVAGESDQALDESPRRVAATRCGRRRVEDDDLAAPRTFEDVGEPVRDHTVVEGGEAPCSRPSAVQRRLHRRRRNPIRLRDLRLEHEHEGHGDPYRDGPVDEPANTHGPTITAASVQKRKSLSLLYRFR